jgi:serine/threonine protein kinase/tetratricopeptide (TPR) repeat protein
LRRKLERLLDAHDKAGGFLRADDGTEATAEEAGGDEEIGSAIGHYKLLQKIGEGGCGIVYMAEQTEPVRRRVALKIIKLGMDTKSVIARFEAERQALALMDHPNIAKVHDAGATETGRPYFVMELVRGTKITEYCDEKNLSTEDRLDLFTKVCQAVQHAHQKGIIHRDLKPSNILVSVNDGVAVPKVIDFGIAKATTDQRLTDKTVFTAFEQFIGTPAYMSPEQAEVTNVDVDTRSDIYSLGVLLYELLTGKTPFDAAELLNIGLDEMRRTIREKEPERPSTRISTLSGDELTTTAKRRGVEAPKLARVLRGDLDWIVMKCLEKDRARRYETANGLARDIARHLNQEPVTACPPSAGYRFRKIVRRHRAAITVAAGFVLLLTIATAVSVRLAFKAQRAAAKATQSESEARAVLTFFEEQVLKAPRAGSAGGQDPRLGSQVKLLDAIAAAESSIANTFSNQPLVEASIRMVIGGTYQELEQVAKALEQYRRALALRTSILGTNNVLTIESMHDMAWALNAAGQLDEALRLFALTLTLQEARLGPDHPSTLGTMKDMAFTYRAARRHNEELALMKRRFELTIASNRPDSNAALLARMNLGQAYLFVGQRSEAISTLKETLRLCKLTPGASAKITSWTMSNLGMAYKLAGHDGEALAMLEENFRFCKTSLPAQDPDTIDTMRDLAEVYAESGRVSEALPLLEDAVRLSKANLGDQKETRSCLRLLALVYGAVGKAEQADPLYREAFESERRTAEHGEPPAQCALADLYLRGEGVPRDPTKAVEWFQKAAEHGNVDAQKRLGSLYLHGADGVNQDSAEAIKWFRKAAESGNAESVNDFAWLLATSVDPKVRDGSNALAFAQRVVALTQHKDSASLDTLAAAYAELSRFEDAVRVQQEAMALLQDGPQKDDLASRLALYQRSVPYREFIFEEVRADAQELERLGEPLEGEFLLRQALDAQRRQLGDTHPDVLPIVDLLVSGLRQEGKHAEAEQMESELLRPGAQRQLETVALLRRRADYFARRGRWLEAAADFRRAIELDPEDHLLWHSLAPLLVRTGDLEAYQEHCRKSLERFGKTTNRSIADRIAKDCMIAPSSGADAGIVSKMVDVALSGYAPPGALPWFQFCKGLAKYRQERFAEAVEWGQSTLFDARSPELCLAAYSLLAMANQRLGHINETEAALTKASEIADTKLPKLETGDIGPAWGDWLIGHSLLSEASELIQPVRSPTPEVQTPDMPLQTRQSSVQSPR